MPVPSDLGFRFHLQCLRHTHWAFKETNGRSGCVLRESHDNFDDVVEY